MPNSTISFRRRDTAPLDRSGARRRAIRTLRLLLRDECADCDDRNEGEQQPHDESVEPGRGLVALLPVDQPGDPQQRRHQSIPDASVTCLRIMGSYRHRRKPRQGENPPIVPCAGSEGPRAPSIRRCFLAMRSHAVGRGRRATPFGIVGTGEVRRGAHRAVLLIADDRVDIARPQPGTGGACAELASVRWSADAALDSASGRLRRDAWGNSTDGWRS